MATEESQEPIYSEIHTLISGCSKEHLTHLLMDIIKVLYTDSGGQFDPCVSWTPDTVDGVAQLLGNYGIDVPSTILAHWEKE